MASRRCRARNPKKSNALISRCETVLPNRKLADPYQRGKLTQHGWRVAYHLARSIKKRKLELPETLPQCLYPPGHGPVVTSPVEDEGDAGGVTEMPKTQAKTEVGETTKKGRKPSVGGSAALKGDKVGAGKGKAKEKSKRKEEAQEEEKGDGAKAGVIGDSKSPNKKGRKSGDRKEQAAGREQKRRSVGGKAASSMPYASFKEMEDSSDQKGEYRMSKSQQARYTKMFDKFTKRRSVQTIDGAKV